MKFSIEAEQSVIGGLLLNNKKIDDVLEIINGSEFYNIDNARIFEAMKMLSHRGSIFDVINLSEYLEENGELESLGGLGYLVEIASNTPSAANVCVYARIVADRAIERAMAALGQRICDIALGDGHVDEKLNMAHEEMAFLERNDGHEIKDFNVLLKAEVTDVDLRFRGEIKAGVSVGFESLDLRFGGLEKDDLWILAARPSMGKTALALNIAYNIAEQGKEVLIFSLEMGEEQLTKRLLSAASSIPYGVLRDGSMQEHNWPQLSLGVSKLKDKKFHIVDIAAIDVNRATAIARKYSRNGNLGIIIVDYLQLMTAKSESRFDEVSQISRKLKAMAKTIGCPVLALSQLSREVEKRKVPIPNNSDLRESGQIEQDADIITFIYREEVYQPDTPHKGTAQLITTKFRNGEIGTDFLATKLQFSRFENMPTGYIRPQEPETKTYSRGFNN